MRRRKARVARALLLLAGVLALASCVPSQDAPPMESRAQQLNETIMCPVCPGESIDQSQNMLAAQMRGVVDEKLSEGWTDEQIRDFFVERYGPSVLMEPPREGLSLAAWALPALVLVLASAALFFITRAMTRGRRGESERNADPAEALSDDELAHYSALVRAAVDGDEDDRSDR